MVPTDYYKSCVVYLNQVELLHRENSKSKVFKSQIPKHKYQINHNDQNSKSQMFGI
jgi:hypothetical protein